jgi:hypothetical protein
MKRTTQKWEAEIGWSDLDFCDFLHIIDILKKKYPTVLHI